MKRTITLVAAVAMMLGMMAMPALAQGPPQHGHVLLLHADFEVNPDHDPMDPASGPPYIVHGFEKCVEIANARALRVHVHHHSIHQGRAGEALRGAGHLTVPLAPLSPYDNCADLEPAP